MRSFLKKSWLILAIVLVSIGIYVASTYNLLVAHDESVNKYFAELQATYQRRLDLLPNLVAVVKANSEYEKTVLEQVAQARALALQVTQNVQAGGTNYPELEAKQAELANAANRLIAVIENYPDLKATEAFGNLQTQMEGTERRILVARRDLNEAVRHYNLKVRGLPSNLVAGAFGFKQKKGFEADAGTERPPEIKF
ncbi:MAG TPA: LemA family protein [Phnomibacter sp.]|nr:LemA family protein [Phnomibacter sp.]